MPYKAIVILLTLIPVLSFSERIAPASDSELSEITRRGRLLAEYDKASALATDALQASGANPSPIKQYIAKKMNDGWHVVFGRLLDKQKAFEVVYEVVQKGGGDKYQVIRNKRTRLDKDVYYKLAKALSMAYQDFSVKHKPKRRYNTAVIPAGGGNVFVYVIPAQLKSGLYPLGGDVRYHISGDGGKILAKRQMHRGIIEKDISEQKRKLGYSFHPAILDDVPEDTDVFHVLVRKPKIPHVVLTIKHQFVYQIAVDGSIRYLGKQKQIFANQGVQGP